MSCKQTQNLLVESQTRELTKSERQIVEQHISRCADCLEESKRHKILTNIFREPSEAENAHIIPQEIMRTRVEAQLKTESSPIFNFNFIKSPIFATLMMTALLVFVVISLYKPTTNNIPYEYTVDLDGIDIEMVEGDETICDMLYAIGVPDASIDVIGCDTTCKLVIFDLKSQQEAEKVIHIFNSMNNDILKTKINKIEHYNIS